MKIFITNMGGQLQYYQNTLIGNIASMPRSAFLWCKNIHVAITHYYTNILHKQFIGGGAAEKTFGLIGI